MKVPTNTIGIRRCFASRGLWIAMEIREIRGRSFKGKSNPFSFDLNLLLRMKIKTFDVSALCFALAEQPAGQRQPLY